MLKTPSIGSHGGGNTRLLLGGMSTHTTPEMVARVSNAGGLGILGCAAMPPHVVARSAEEIRALSDRPFGMNLLLFPGRRSCRVRRAGGLPISLVHCLGISPVGPEGRFRSGPRSWGQGGPTWPPP